VYVLTALDKHLQAQVDEPDLDETAARFEERRRRHVDHLKRLAECGAWLRSANDCHAKFCVIDDEIAIVTSANSTPEAYESNPEDGLVVRQSAAAYELGRLFAHIWQHLSEHDSTPGTALDVHSLPERSPPTWRSLGRGGGVTPVATMRSYEASLQRTAIEIIDSAQARLAIATYSFIGMETHPIGAALEKAIARGVEVDVLVQPRNHICAQRITCQWFLELAPDHVRLYGHRRTHTKSIIADDRFGLIWTGNLEATHGWNNGIEVGLRIEDAGVASAVARWISDVMRRATHRPVISPSEEDLTRLGVPTKEISERLFHK
jgi:phosphatidylserine/phosphatidylglycerophosphate/cardiolipin synthase-like enzyme